MKSLYAVVIAILDAVGIVDWRCAQRGGNHLAIVEPSGIFAVVVIVVNTTYLVGEGAVLVMINRATLVFEVEIFKDDILDMSELLELKFKANKLLVP